MTGDNWIPLVRQLKPAEIELRIGELKERIRADQREIVTLTVIRVAIERGEEFSRISEKKAREAVDEALRIARLDYAPPIRANAEGAMTSKSG